MLHGIIIELFASCRWPLVYCHPCWSCFHSFTGLWGSSDEGCLLFLLLVVCWTNFLFHTIIKCSSPPKYEVCPKGAYIYSMISKWLDCNVCRKEMNQGSSGNSMRLFILMGFLDISLCYQLQRRLWKLFVMLKVVCQLFLIEPYILCMLNMTNILILGFVFSGHK